MKAKLVFNLPEEQSDLKFSMNGIKWALAMNDLDNKLRNMQKYENIENISIDDCREMIREILAADFLSLEEIE